MSIAGTVGVLCGVSAMSPPLDVAASGYCTGVAAGLTGTSAKALSADFALSCWLEVSCSRR